MAELVDEALDLKAAAVARMLGCKPVTVRAYVAEGWLVPKTRSGRRGTGHRNWFDRGEVEAFRDGGAPAAAEYRARKARRTGRARR